MPGDPNGHLRLAFRLAEVIGDLSADENSSEDITELNQYFSEFRNAAASEVQTCRERLGTKLEAIAEQHPELVSRIADFQSQLDEQIRRAADDDSRHQTPRPPRLPIDLGLLAFNVGVDTPRLPSLDNLTNNSCIIGNDKLIPFNTAVSLSKIRPENTRLYSVIGGVGFKESDKKEGET